MCPCGAYCRVQRDWILIKSLAGFRNSNLSEDPQPLTSCSECGLHLWRSCSSQPRLFLLHALFSFCPHFVPRLVTAIPCEWTWKVKCFEKWATLLVWIAFLRKQKTDILLSPTWPPSPFSFPLSIGFYFTLTLSLSYMSSRSRTHVNSTCTSD